MTNNIITLIVLASAMGIVLVYGECKVNGPLIKSCCCLGYNNTYFNAKQSGVYATMAHFCGVNCSTTRVYCDTTSGGGGWLVIQRREKQNDSISFHRSWTEYADGFGDLYKEFWLGLRGIHCLTSNGNWELRIDFTFDNGTKSFMHYNHFRVGPATDNYRLSILGFTGITPEDPFTALHSINGYQFSTYDRANGPNKHCAVTRHGGTEPGGWWYHNCFYINLNYDYGNPSGFMYLAHT